jgi:hypothetical protein
LRNTQLVRCGKDWGECVLCAFWSTEAEARLGKMYLGKCHRNRPALARFRGAVEADHPGYLAFHGFPIAHVSVGGSVVIVLAGRREREDFP